MRNKKRIFAAVTSLVLLLTGCGCKGTDIVADKETKRRESTGERWTVMVYMSASDLEENYRRAGDVLGSLAYDLPENINVIVETGGCGNWQTEGIKNDRIQDFAVRKNGIIPVYESLLKNMGESGTYADFVARTTEAYPADRYMSIIWGDGGGISDGAAHDATYNYDSLTVGEIADALVTTGVKLDIIGFDSSLMSNIETAAALSLYADYMVAAEDIMPSTGWDYRGLFEYISDNPAADSVSVGQVICDGVVNRAADSVGETSVMAVTDLSKITRVVQALDTMYRNMAEVATQTEGMRRIASEVKLAEQVGANSPYEGYSNLADSVSLGDAVFRATGDDSARIGNIVSKAVVYKATDTSNADMSGLNIFYPFNANVEQINAYRKLCPIAGFSDFLDCTVANDLLQDRSIDYKGLPSWQYYNGVVGASSISAACDLQGKYILTVSNPEIVANTGVNIYKYDEVTGDYIYLTTDCDTTYSAEVNGYEYEFKETLLEMNGTPVSAYLVRRNDTCEIYSIPVIYNERLASIRVKAVTNDRGEREYAVLGLWNGINPETGVIEPNFVRVNVGDAIVPIYSEYGSTDGEPIKGKSIRLVFGGLSFAEKTMPDGDYLLSYSVEDMYGMLSESNTTNVTALKGKIKAVK